MKHKDFITTEGGITAPRGFTSSGIAAGIKKSGKKDLALLLSSSPCTAAGTFTTNRICAPCVTKNKTMLPADTIRALVCNSGNANACTGAQGVADVDYITRACEEALDIPADTVLTASTGVIGEFLPREKITDSLGEAVENLSHQGSLEFATAIMTTDTVPKEYALTVDLSSGTVRIGGVCKGAGMIQPNMATMLGFITTDAAVDSSVLSDIHRETVQNTFNNLTIDGDTSTNDMVVVLANGAANVRAESSADLTLLKQAFFAVYNTLCARIAQDGEGATKRIEINVRRGKTNEDCRLAAKAVANSNLVKTAMFGNDPNWGRILCAVGYSGAELTGDRLNVSVCGTPVFSAGRPTDFFEKELSGKLHGAVVEIDIDLGFKTDTHAVAHTCDFSYEYVRINAEYHT
ncbi:MAG: bifunctional glutamate N-acetyltransferase/amino-acid acetyltransferase ArgJ [Fibrobacterota bacterium]